MKSLLIGIVFIILTSTVFSQEKKDSIFDYYKVPGTVVSFIPPKYFMALPIKNTFIHPTSSASIQVNEIDGTPFPMLIKNITPEYIEQQKAKFIKRIDTLTFDGKKATIFVVSFNVESKDSAKTVIEFERFMFFTGDYNKTIWINANYPIIAKEVLADVLLNSLLTTKFEN